MKRNFFYVWKFGKTEKVGIWLAMITACVRRWQQIGSNMRSWRKELVVFVRVEEDGKWGQKEKPRKQGSLLLLSMLWCGKGLSNWPERERENEERVCGDYPMPRWTVLTQSTSCVDKIGWWLMQPRLDRLRWAGLTHQHGVKLNIYQMISVPGNKHTLLA